MLRSAGQSHGERAFAPHLLPPLVSVQQPVGLGVVQSVAFVVVALSTHRYVGLEIPCSPKPGDETIPLNAGNRSAVSRWLGIALFP